MTMRQPRIFTIYLQHTDKNQAEGLGLLMPWIARVLSGLQSQVLVVDNARPANEEISLGSGMQLIGGDNSCREFSGFDKGVWWLGSRHEINDNDIFIFATETFFISYGIEYMDWFLPEVTARSLALNKIVGYVDAYPEEIEVLGLKCKSWARTSLFLLNHATLKNLLPLAIPCGDAQVFSDVSGEFFSEDAPISGNYKQFLRTWLFGEVPSGAVFRERWHSHRALTPENLAAFRAKAKAILCEHYFSARARRLGIEICDVRQYAGSVKAAAPAPLPVVSGV